MNFSERILEVRQENQQAPSSILVHDLKTNRQTEYSGLFLGSVFTMESCIRPYTNSSERHKSMAGPSAQGGHTL